MRLIAGAVLILAASVLAGAVLVSGGQDIRTIPGLVAAAVAAGIGLLGFGVVSAELLSPRRD